MADAVNDAIADKKVLVMRDTEAVVTGTAKKWATARPREVLTTLTLCDPTRPHHEQEAYEASVFLTSSRTTPAGNRQYLLVLTGHIHLTGYTRTRVLVRTRAVFTLLLFGQHEFRTCRPMGSPRAIS